MPAKFSIFFVSLFLILSGCGGGSTGSKESGSAPSDAAQTGSAGTEAPAVDPNAGAISGSIKFAGQKPSPKTIKMGADAYCKGQHTAKVFSEEVLVNANGTLQNVYVYVKSGLAETAFPAPAQPAVLDQKGCIYTPHVLVVQAGQELLIRNSDGVLHNVNARPKNNKGFNIGQPVKGMETKKSFAKAEVGIPVKCDVHPWMRGYINVQTHPFGVVAGEDGSFKIENLPPGSYEVEAWHEKLGTQTQKITVGAKENKSISFTFKGA